MGLITVLFVCLFVCWVVCLFVGFFVCLIACLFFAKVRSKALKICCTFWGLMNWNLSQIYAADRVENSSNFWQISLVGVIFFFFFFFFFLLKVGSEELNHAATGDLKNGGRGLKGAGLLTHRPLPPFQVSAPPPRSRCFSIPTSRTHNTVNSRQLSWFGRSCYVIVLKRRWIPGPTTLIYIVAVHESHVGYRPFYLPLHNILIFSQHFLYFDQGSFPPPFVVHSGHMLCFFVRTPATSCPV